MKPAPSCDELCTALLGHDHPYTIHSRVFPSYLPLVGMHLVAFGDGRDACGAGAACGPVEPRSRLTASPLLLRRTTMTIRTLESHGQRDYLQPPLSALKPPSIRPTSLPCIGPLRCCAKRQWSGRILITRRVRHAASTAHHRTPCGSQFYLLTPDRIHRNCTQSSAPLRLQLGKSSSRSC